MPLFCPRAHPLVGRTRWLSWPVKGNHVPAICLIIILLLAYWYSLPARPAGDYLLAFCLSIRKRQVLCLPVGLSFCSGSHGADSRVPGKFPVGWRSRRKPTRDLCAAGLGTLVRSRPSCCHVRVQNPGKWGPITFPSTLQTCWLTGASLDNTRSGFS